MLEAQSNTWFYEIIEINFGYAESSKFLQEKSRELLDPCLLAT